jgi:hypothetical protein
MSNDNSSTRRDTAGTPYSTTGTGPVPSNTPIVVHGPYGGVPGRMVDGVAVPDKK